MTEETALISNCFLSCLLKRFSPITDIICLLKRKTSALSLKTIYCTITADISQICEDVNSQQ